MALFWTAIEKGGPKYRVTVVLMCWLCETELCATLSNTRPQEEEVDYTLQPFYLVKASRLRQVYQLSTVL
jgi:hypothetical protein